MYSKFPDKPSTCKITFDTTTTNTIISKINSNTKKDLKKLRNHYIDNYTHNLISAVIFNPTPGLETATILRLAKKSVIEITGGNVSFVLFTPTDALLISNGYKIITYEEPHRVNLLFNAHEDVKTVFTFSSIEHLCEQLDSLSAQYHVISSNELSLFINLQHPITQELVIVDAPFQL